MKLINDVKIWYKQNRNMPLGVKISIIYNFILRKLIKIFFRPFQRLGVHISPNHYYQPIPDTRTLKNSIWDKKTDLIGININEKGQIDLLKKFKIFKNEYDKFSLHKTNNLAEYYVRNGGFESVDGEILYSMVRYFKPKTVLEIGSGNSTYLSALAMQKNKEENNTGKLIAIEPYPNDVLKKGFSGLNKLIEKELQSIPLSQFESLKENDILFIDSTHVLKINSDVKYEYLEILPRLPKGVIIHIHDIFLPLEYPKDWVLKDFTFWNEQYLLQAFLCQNNNFEIIWSSSFMNLNNPKLLTLAFSSYKENEKWPASFWIRKVK